MAQSPATTGSTKKEAQLPQIQLLPSSHGLEVFFIELSLTKTRSLDFSLNPWKLPLSRQLKLEISQKI